MGGRAQLAYIYDDANLLCRFFAAQNFQHILDPVAVRNAADGVCATDDFIDAQPRRSADHCGEPFRYAEVWPDSGTAGCRSRRMWAVGARSDRLRPGAIWRRSGTV